MEILWEKYNEVEKEVRDKVVIIMVINLFLYLEKEVIEYIFEEFGGIEGLFIVLKVVDRVGIIWLVIVNVLCKFESVGVIELCFFGMKGIFIKVKKDKFFDEFEKNK